MKGTLLAGKGTRKIKRLIIDLATFSSETLCLSRVRLLFSVESIEVLAVSGLVRGHKPGTPSDMATRRQMTKESSLEEWQDTRRDSAEVFARSYKRETGEVARIRPGESIATEGGEKRGRKRAGNGKSKFETPFVDVRSREMNYTRVDSLTFFELFVFSRGRRFKISPTRFRSRLSNYFRSELFIKRYIISLTTRIVGPRSNT